MRPRLTPTAVRTRVNLALKLDAAQLDEHFGECVSTLFEELIQAIAYGRCDDPGRGGPAGASGSRCKERILMPVSASKDLPHVYANGGPRLLPHPRRPPRSRGRLPAARPADHFKGGARSLQGGALSQLGRRCHERHLAAQNSRCVPE